MRLIYTTHDAEQGRTFANFLSSEGIENQLEMTTNDDWGNEDYGVTTFKIWVIDEEAAEAAEKWVQSFIKDPKNSFYQRKGFKTTVLPTLLTSEEYESKTSSSPGIDLKQPAGKSHGKNSPLKQEPLRTITTGLLILCCLFYLISNLTAPQINNIPNILPAAPIVFPPINKSLLYDYPYAFELVDKLVKLYGIEKLQTPNDLPPEGKYLFNQFQKTPYWEGYYNIWLAHLQHVEPPAQAPLFEKIRQGEVWRLFTPCLMHTDFLHLLFNMLWLIVLGKQLEQRLNARRYLFLILIVGIFSNTCQYLMSGSNFIGFSGVVCGMVAFIWIRQKIAPWEGYPLERATSLFIVYFITAIFAIQLISFYTEIYHHLSISPGIANTAHFTGLLMGVLLGFIPFFKKSSPLKRPIK